MVDRDEALRLAQRHLGRTDIVLDEFDEGWVGRMPPPPRPVDPATPPETIGAVAVAVRREDGRVVTMPDVGMERIVERYRREVSTDGRYPDDVQSSLRRFGWFPGRRRSPAMGRAIALVESVAGRDGVPLPHLHLAARQALEEFSGVVLLPEGRPPVVFAPGRDQRDLPDLAIWTKVTQQLSTPAYGIGTWYDGLYNILVTADMRVVLAAERHSVLLGEDLPEGIIALARGVPGSLRVIGQDGIVTDDPRGFRGLS